MFRYYLKYSSSTHAQPAHLDSTLFTFTGPPVRALCVFGGPLVYDLSYHLNRDFQNMMVSSYQSVSLQVVKGIFGRIYNKEKGFRVEVGISNSSIDDMLNFVTGDFRLFSAKKY